jgi:hypothetical protein
MIDPQDPFIRWTALQRWSNDKTNRLDESTDLAFWDTVAETRVAPHDVAFAANAFYRMLDLRRALTTFVAAARRRGIVVWSRDRRQCRHRLVGY